MKTKAPPHDLPAEESVLASCLLFRDSIEIAVDLLVPSDFYRTAHQRIFAGCLELFQKKVQPDLVSVTGHLRDKGLLENVGGAGYLSRLLDTPVCASMEHACNRLKQKATLRLLLEGCHQTISDIFACPDDALDRAQARIMGITTSNGPDVVPVSQLVVDANERYGRLSKSDGEITGISTGYFDLDRLTAGLQGSDLIIIAARPSMGKTALATNIAVNMASHERPVLFFSLEMSKEQLIDRIVSAEASINLLKFRTGKLSGDDWERVTRSSGNVYGWPLWVDDSSSLHWHDIVQRTRRARREKGIQAVFIDYLQYIQGDPGYGKNYEIESITRGLKGLAKDIGIPVILLSQLNRELEKRPHPYKRPQLSDLRDSGAIEQDADLILFLYRPERYGEADSAGNDQAGIAELIISKHRNGPLGTIKLLFRERCVRFESLKL